MHTGPLNLSIEDQRLWYFRARILSVVNGDTVVALVDRGFNDYACMRLRLFGVDAPDPEPRNGPEEKRRYQRKLGLAAKHRLAAMIQGHEVILRTYKSSKPDRFLAEIYVPGDVTRTANSILLDEGLAVRFGDPPMW